MKDKLFRKKMRPLDFFLLFVSFLINVLGRFLCIRFQLPFWLDSIGTCYSTILFGIIPGALVGLITNISINFFSDYAIYYFLVNISIAVIVGLTFPKELNEKFQIIRSAAITGVVAVLISAPFNLFLFDGYTGNQWGDGLFDMLSQFSHFKLMNAVLSEAFVDIPDKVISLLCCTGLLILSNKMKGKPNENS